MSFQNSLTVKAFSKKVEDMSPEEWTAHFNKQRVRGEREGMLQDLSASQRAPALPGGFGSGVPPSFSSSSSSSSASSLFGGLGGDLFEQTKKAADLRFDLDKRQAELSGGLRETESQNNFGRNTQLAAQQITGQKDLSNIQQEATTKRLERQLDSQQSMQRTANDQTNLFRAQSAALATRGLR